MKFQPFGNKKGSILAFVVILSSILMVSAMTVLSSIENNQKYSVQATQKNRSSFEAEGFIKALVNLTKVYMQESNTISTELLIDYFEPQLATITPPGHLLKSWSVEILSDSDIQSIPSGPFVGMQGDSRKIKYAVTLENIAGQFESSASLEGLLAGVAITQFGLFSFSSVAMGSIVNRILVSGRVHANGGVMMGSSLGNPANAVNGTEYASVKQLTAGGPITRYPNIGANVPRIYVASDDTSTNYRQIIPGAFSGCVNCDGSGLNWLDYSMSRWNGKVQDVVHKVPRITLKTVEEPQVQRNPSYNTPNLRERMLIDPVRSVDHISIKETKISYKADIRIINGVWYIKNPSNVNQWPGIPVWSDHPGSYQTNNEEGILGNLAVGQEDIRAWLINNPSAANHAWPAGTVPRKFSYYEYDSALNKIRDETTGIISYGNLKRNATHFLPGHYVSNNIGGIQSSFCPVSPGVYGPCVNCLETAFQNRLYSITEPVTCSLGSEPDMAAKIINSTRSGFRFGLWMFHTAGTPAVREARSKIYPVNFDIKAFQEALLCDYDPLNPGAGSDHPGEIGCYFTPWGLVGKPFNGIVYISSTWDSSLEGFNGDLPERPPFAHGDVDTTFPGSNIDLGQALPLHPTQNQSLPFELCSTSFAGRTFDANGLFTVPDCSRYQNSNNATTVRPRINALRIMNGATIDSVRLPAGLTIASNLHAYIMGNLNSDSVVTSQVALPWSPVLVAVDDVFLLSNSWLDHNSRWDVAPNTLSRVASNTTYNAALMKYWPNLLLNENWSGRTLAINGPSILSHKTVYPEIITNYSTGSSTWNPPSSEIIRFDPHFELIRNQPPGAPYLTIFSTSGWKSR